METKTKIEDYTLTTKQLKNYIQTVEEIKRLAKTYWTDLLEKNKFNFDFSKAILTEVHDFIKNLQYVKDPKNHEFTTRPKLSLALANMEVNGKRHYLDCDDKTILMLSYFILQNNKISGKSEAPYLLEIVCSGRKDKPHHVYPQVSLNGFYDKLIVDATYPKNEIGKPLFKENFRKVFNV